MSSLVKMVRDSKVYPAPHTANVPPQEVVNYIPGGWEVAKEEKEEEKNPPKKSGKGKDKAPVNTENDDEDEIPLPE